jgi:hypothetical protein
MIEDCSERCTQWPGFTVPVKIATTQQGNIYIYNTKQSVGKVNFPICVTVARSQLLVERERAWGNSFLWIAESKSTRESEENFPVFGENLNTFLRESKPKRKSCAFVCSKCKLLNPAMNDFHFRENNIIKIKQSSRKINSAVERLMMCSGTTG